MMAKSTEDKAPNTSNSKLPATQSPKSTQTSSHRKQLLPYHDNSNSRSDHEKILEEDESAFIEPLFQIALHIAQSSFTRSSMIQPTYNDKLLLYSLYKQAVHGDVKNSTIPRPGIFDLLGRAKWDAWKARGGLSSTEAKKLYLECVLNILRSHRQSPEAKSLIEMLSSYEAYSAMADRFSESEEDADSTEHIPIPSSSGHDATYQEEQRVEKEIKENSQPDDHPIPSEDLRSSGLGPYITPSQLPDPVQSPSSHMFPPNSPTTPATTGSGSLSGSPHQSTPARSESSTPGRSVAGEKEVPTDEPSVGSERRFTEEQVERLVQKASHRILEGSSREMNDSPGKGVIGYSQPGSFLMKDGQISTPSSNDKHLMSSKNLNDLKESITRLDKMLSKFEAQLQMITTLLEQNSLSIENKKNEEPTLPIEEVTPLNNNLFISKSLVSWSKTHLIRPLLFKFSFKHLLFDLSLILILFKFLRTKSDLHVQNKSRSKKV